MSDGRQLVKLAWALCAFLVSVSGRMHGQSVQSLCANTTWSNCGGWRSRKHYRRILVTRKTYSRSHRLGAWPMRPATTSFEKRGVLKKATPDADKIFEAVSSKLNPLEIAKDKTVDALVKKYFARLAPVVEWAGGSIAEGFNAFFDSSEIATDYDELRLMNDDIQSRVSTLLQPYFKPDWKQTLNQAVKEAGPQLRKQ